MNKVGKGAADRDPRAIGRRASATGATTNARPGAPGKDAKAPTKAKAPASRDATNAPGVSGVAVGLDREPDETHSDPVAAREVTRRQSRAARTMTGAGDDRDSLFDNMSREDGSGHPQTLIADDDSGPLSESGRTGESGGAGTTGIAAEAQQTPETSAASYAVAQDPQDPNENVVANPIEQEQRADLEVPPGFEAGSPTPTVPTFDGQTPTKTEQLPGNGGSQETFKKDGVTYVRTSRPDGTVSTSYNDDGVSYSQTVAEDGSSSLSIFTEDDNGSHGRSVKRDADGEIVADASHSAQRIEDKKTGEVYFESHDVSVDDGVTTTTEKVTRPDGGVSNYTEVDHGDSRVEQTYTYEGEQGSVSRVTTQTASGSETRREKNYEVDVPIESVVDGPEPPGYETNVVPLPEGQRDKTQVHQVEVSTNDGSGPDELQYRENSYSQASHDIGFTDQDNANIDTFQRPLAAVPGESTVTRTVSVIEARDENGNLLTSSAGGQEVKLVGAYPDDFELPPVSVTRSDTWNSAGESTASFSSDGWTRADLERLSAQSDSDGLGPFGVTIGGRYVSASAPDSDKSLIDNLVMKGSGEAEDWLGAGDDDKLDVNVTVSRDAEGHVTLDSQSYSTVDDSGNGKAITRAKGPGGVSWTYTNSENDGQDYQRQTVYEGSEISVYEAHAVTGPGQFTTTSETWDGDERIAHSDASRKELTEAELRDYKGFGSLDPEQLERILQDGPPYYVENFTSTSKPLLDDKGQLRLDPDGNPIQIGSTVDSAKFSNEQGYAVSDLYRTEGGKESRYVNADRISTVTDPLADPPITAHLRNTTTDTAAKSHQTTVNQDSNIEIGKDGVVRVDGDTVAELELGGANIEDLIRSGEGGISAGTIVGGLVDAAKLGAKAAKLAAKGTVLRLIGDNPYLKGYKNLNDFIKFYDGVTGLFSGISDGDVAGSAKSIGGIASSLKTVTAAISILGSETGRLTAIADSFASGAAGKVAGVVGGAVTLGFGVAKIFSSEDGWGQASGALDAAAGGVLIASAFGGPVGLVVGGVISGGLSLASFLVAGGGANDTAHIDDRLKE